MKTIAANLSIRAYDEIKKLILSGELKQGTAISMSVLAEQLDISRTPVTNACQRLEHEKFLTIVPKQGVIINTITIEEAYGIYELRAAIESYNARHVIDILTDEDIEILRSSLQKQISSVESGDAKAFMDEDHYFHRYILQKKDNQEMLSVINHLYDRAYMLGIKNSYSRRLKESVQEHQRIIEALEKRDKLAFADAIEDNILNGFRSLTQRYLT